MRVKLVEIKSLKISCPDNRLEREQAQMKKDLAEVKAYAEAMADSNRARDAYHWGQRGCYPGGKLRVY